MDPETLSLKHLGTVTNCKKIPELPYKRSIYHEPPKVLPNLKYLIKELKETHSTFPIFKVFKSLRQKCGERFYKVTSEKPKTNKPIEEVKPVKRKRGRPRKKKVEEEKVTEVITLDDSVVELNENLPANMSMWTEKYKPTSSEDLFSNIGNVKELKSWLQSWVEYSMERKSSRKRKRQNSNSSDDFCVSDSDTRDTMDVIPQNTMMLIGPHGCGKTSTVYAICNELNINVIEINASSKRPGKKILSDLQVS